MLPWWWCAGGRGQGGHSSHIYIRHLETHLQTHFGFKLKKENIFNFQPLRRWFLAVSLPVKCGSTRSFRKLSDSEAAPAYSGRVAASQSVRTPVCVLPSSCQPHTTSVSSVAQLDLHGPEDLLSQYLHLSYRNIMRNMSEKNIMRNTYVGEKYFSYALSTSQLNCSRSD